MPLVEAQAAAITYGWKEKTFLAGKTVRRKERNKKSKSFVRFVFSFMPLSARLPAKSGLAFVPFPK